MTIPDGPFTAYIFDCDGTLADSMPLHYRAWTRAMADMGGIFPEEVFYSWGGMPTIKIVERLNDKYGLTMDPPETVLRKERYYMELIPEVRPIEAVVEIARRMHGTLPMAVASGGHREMVEATVHALGIWDWFEAVVCAEDYVHGKPAPDPFLEAARRLGLEPEGCLVFEDSPTGIEAAKAAGMGWVLVPGA